MKNFFCLAAIVLALTGCANNSAVETTANGDAKNTSLTRADRVLGIFSPYRIDIQQGNFVSEEMVAQIKPGMTRNQVIFVLGTPLVTDIFHAGRWDYPFRLHKANGDVIMSRVTVFFSKDDRVARVQSDDLPTEQDYIKRIAD